MSPEQAKGEALDARTDLFSLGIVLYEMTTGALPFPGDNAGMMLEKILTRKPTAPILLNAAVPANLDSIINKALEKDRSRRYQRASDIRSDLQRLQQSLDASGFWRTLLRRVGWPRQ
jgi:serine/threonine protein kinase